MGRKSGRYGTALWQEFRIDEGTPEADQVCWWCDSKLVEDRPRTIVRLEWSDDTGTSEFGCFFHAPCFHRFRNVGASTRAATT